MIASLIRRYKAWRKRRYWAARHLQFLQNMISDDWRWLASDPTCDALTTRYKRAASSSWYELEHESPSVFRQRLGEIAPRPDAPKGQIKDLSSNGGREGVCR
jgi:hypothetical protein